MGQLKTKHLLGLENIDKGDIKKAKAILSSSILDKLITEYRALTESEPDNCELGVILIFGGRGPSDSEFKDIIFPLFAELKPTQLICCPLLWMYKQKATKTLQTVSMKQENTSIDTAERTYS